MNLVSIIMQMLTPALLGKLTSGLGGGVDQSIVQKAAGAGIPAILAGLAGVAGQSGGGSLIANAISKLDPSLMGNLGNILGGPAQGALTQTGTNILGSLLGNSALGTLAGAIGKFSGLPGGASTGLLGALVPIVLGTLGQQQKSMGLDAGGLAKLLGDQKANIQAALPGDFSKLLSGTGLLEGALGQATGAAAGMASAATNIASGAANTAQAAAAKATTAASSAAQSASNAASSAAKTASNTVSAATRTARASVDSASSGGSWLPWIIGLIALAAIAWFLLGRSAPPPAPAPAPAPAATAPAAPAAPMVKVGDLDVTGAINGAIGKLTTALPTIKDEASAKAALPDLTAAGDAIAKVNGVAGQIPADGKTALAALIKPAIAALAPLVTAAESNAAAGPIVKPVLDTVMSQLDALSK